MALKGSVSYITKCQGATLCGQIIGPSDVAVTGDLEGGILLP